MRRPRENPEATVSIRVGARAAIRLAPGGISDAPHRHVGAMRGDLAKPMGGEIPIEDVVPLQVRFDLAAMGRLSGYMR